MYKKGKEQIIKKKEEGIMHDVYLFSATQLKGTQLTN